MKNIYEILKGAGLALFIMVLLYIAILFTGIGDKQVYQYTGYDITGKAQEKYHNSLQEQQKETIEKAKEMPQTDFVVDSIKYDFGTIPDNVSQKHTYILTNTGENPLVILDVSVSCGCTLADYTKSPVNPGEKAEITISFDPTGKSGHVEKSLMVYANVPDVPRSLHFTADIITN